MPIPGIGRRARRRRARFRGRALSADAAHPRRVGDRSRWWWCCRSRELALVRSAAGRRGMATSAWLGEVGAREAARGSGDGDGMPATPGAFLQRLMCARAELMDSHRVLRNVGGNLNDVARYANSTGRLAVETAQVQALVARAVTRVDVAVADLAGLLAATQRAQLRATRRIQRPAPR